MSLKRPAALLLAGIIAAGTLCGCGGKTSEPVDPGTRRETRTQLLQPKAEGTDLLKADGLSIDCGNASEGYLVVRYSGGKEKGRAQITAPDEAVYHYTIPADTDVVLPLTRGSGTYHVDMLEQVQESLYALLYSADLDVAVEDELRPFLYPNYYVGFAADDEVVKLSADISRQSYDDLNFVSRVYHYVIENITYDTDAAASIPTDYVPSADRTIASGKGICFDYASLMAAMLRCQGVPTRLEVGYAGDVYHAWISVWLAETGWVDSIIRFDGSDWSLMDPTLAAGNNAENVKAFIGDGSRYLVKYSY